MATPRRSTWRCGRAIRRRPDAVDVGDGGAAASGRLDLLSARRLLVEVHRQVGLGDRVDDPLGGDLDFGQP